ncbi:hypothetical protein WJX75_005774 [Coccomyxa subellipsoidea]|uniref:Ubiquitin-like domain-containing protein n=1 Tax=Coccomyxa subellipsoidea TaxID=248742 RepID=A0ABR2YN42_9CHLO
MTKVIELIDKIGRICLGALAHAVKLRCDTFLPLLDDMLTSKPAASLLDLVRFQAASREGNEDQGLLTLIYSPHCSALQLRADLDAVIDCRDALRTAGLAYDSSRYLQPVVVSNLLRNFAPPLPALQPAIPQPRVAAAAGLQGLRHIRVRLQSGAVLTATYDDRATVGCLVKWLEQPTGLPPDEQRLLRSGGMRLEDTTPLSAYNLPDFDVIDLVPGQQALRKDLRTVQGCLLLQTRK